MITKTPQYHEWKRDLKVGDEVAVNRRNRYGVPFEIWTVKKFTPTQIVLQNGAAEQRVNRDTGRILGKNSYRDIEPLTQKMRDANERARLVTDIDMLKTTALQKVPLDNLRQAWLLLSVEEVKNV
jgi:hypothetical protein